MVVQGGHKPGKPGILKHFCEHENSGNSVQHQRKIVTNRVFLVRHLNICVKCGAILLEYMWYDR